MKKLLKKLVNIALQKTEDALLAQASLHKMGISHLYGSYFYPIAHPEIWESHYYDIVTQIKSVETAE